MMSERATKQFIARLANQFRKQRVIGKREEASITREKIIVAVYILSDSKFTCKIIKYMEKW